MSVTKATRTIQAPIERVFGAVSDVRSFQLAVPHILEVEFLSAQKTGVGTRFRETRRMGKRVATTELEVTEWVENQHVRFVSDEGGTIWDTVFRVEPADGGIRLSLEMEARAYKLLAKLFNPLIRGMVARAIERDMDAIQDYCQGSAVPTDASMDS